MNIYDIAAEAGTSISTVSRVLNNKGNVNPQIRKRVEEVLKKYDYKSITKIQVTFGDNVGYGFNGALVLGNWAEQKSYHSNDMKSDNTITFDVKNPQDCLTLYRYWGEVDLKSVTLYFD